MTTPILRIGTRGSPMALAQANQVRNLLAARYEELTQPGALETVVVKTTGDMILDRTLADIGGKELFTKEIEEALYRNEIDLAMHSLKDMPTFLPPNLMIACVLERDDPRDAWLSPSGQSLADLAPGAIVGTASLRRQSQILHVRPDLRVEPIRGNAGTRMTKLSEGNYSATLLAISGLRRLNLEKVVTQILDYDDFLPAVAQGAIAVECREADEKTRAYLAPLNHAESQQRVDMERAFLAVVNGSCRTPIAGLAEIIGDDEMWFRGLVARPDGTEIWRVERRCTIHEALGVGKDAGEELKAQIDLDVLQL